MLRQPTGRGNVNRLSRREGSLQHCITHPKSHTQDDLHPLPTLGSSMGLGLKHTWVHLQVRNMTKEWAFEIGLVDVLGQEGRVRFATFQVRVFSRSLARLVAIPL